MKHITLLLFISLRLFAQDSSHVLSDSVNNGKSTTYSLKLWGGALATFAQNSGPKGSANGLFHGKLTHNFTPTLWTTIALRAAYGFDTPLIETGALGFSHNRFSMELGLLSVRLGTATLYRPYYSSSPFFEHYTLWDTYGFGVAPTLTFNSQNSLSFTGTINERENIALLLNYTYHNKILTTTIVGGVQSTDMQTQDIQIRGGAELSIGNSKLSGHLIGNYTHAIGYGSATNSTIVPYDIVTILLEGAIRPTSFITYSTILSYQWLKKTTSSTQWIVGNNISLHPLRWGGPSATLELFPGQTYSITQEYRWDLTPPKISALFSIGYRNEQTHTSYGKSSTHAITGTLWFEI